jgi:ELWxxDGT repeat protein
MWLMKKILSLGLLAVVLTGILHACNIGGSPTEDSQTLLSGGDLPALGLSVQAQSGTYNTVGQAIPFQYVVTNTGGTVLAGPVTITDSKAVVICPAVNTVGNLNNDLDPAESLTCTSSYSITQADLNAGSVTSAATATAGGVNSNTTTTTVQMTPFKVLELVSTANPTTYSQTGQVITFAYVIKNTGTAALGPAQFAVNDDRLGKINCGAADTSLAAGASISCSGTYTTTESDRSLSELVFNTTVSGGGAATIQPVQVKVTNTAVVSNPPAGYARGATIQHQVREGEWMLQIARCYGADFNAVRNANPQVSDPAKIWPVNVLTIPNIGSNGNIYGPPCVEYYTAQSGDTWSSIAQKFNADLAVLQEANKNVSLANGIKLKIPRNSANGNPVPVGNEPIRLNFPAGSPKVTVSGTVAVSKVRDRYVLTASQEQTLAVTLTAPTGGLELAVLSAGGTALKSQNATLTFSGTIPSNGDYYVDVVNATTADRQYTLEVVLTTPVSAERVVDINPGAADSSPAYLTVFNNILYFSATGLDNAGAELWRYDGASNSVSRVKDIFPGTDSSNPSYLAVYNGALYFSANGNDGAGVELWRFNGADVGRLSDINSGAGNANPSFMTVYNGRLYFSANSSDGTGVELWQTDGNTVGRVADIYSGAGDSKPSYLAVFNNALYFSATSNDGAGTELWKYDGTTASRATDINPGVGNANPAYLAVFNNILYFSANANDGAGTELWKYDGTTSSRAADINAGAGDSIPAYLTVFNGLLYFSANGNDGAGYELWQFNGTTASRAADINKTGDSLPSHLVVFNTRLFFQANGGDGAGRELWRFKGP